MPNVSYTIEQSSITLEPDITNVVMSVEDVTLVVESNPQQSSILVPEVVTVEIIETGPQGPQGLPGQQGIQGIPGLPGSLDNNIILDGGNF